MNIISKLLIAASVVVVTASTASACNINYRQTHQNHRVIKGVFSGQLNYAEFRRIEALQADVRMMERVARADGYISPAECALLNRKLNVQSVRIWVKKHN